MRLVNPTDYEILEALNETGRNTATNLSILLDRDRSYINTELSKLGATELITQIGPAENSGLYEITVEGEQVVKHWQKHGGINGDYRQIFD